MTGIQKEKFISHSVFIIKISSLQHYHLLLSTLVDSVVAIPGGMTDIKMIFNPCPHV
jgi:hypothetical protein